MDFSKNSITHLSILSLFLAIFILLHTYPHLVSKSPFFSSQKIQANSSVKAKDELEQALEKASMPNKTVIIAIVNKAYVEPHNDQYPTMFDLFLEGFWFGEDTQVLIDHLLLVTMDQIAYQRCVFRHLHCYRLVTDGVDFAGEKVYMSDDFIKMMWRRTSFLLEVLKRGYNFIFTDTDVLWLRNPFPKLGDNHKLDLQISTDAFNGDPSSKDNIINTGFYSIRSSNKTVALFENWYEMRKTFTRMKEQDVLAKMVQKDVFRRLGLHVRFLDTMYFSGFCKDSQDFRAVVTVHANCCRSISAKVADLKTVLRDWRRFIRAASNKNFTNTAFRWSKHIACINSWKKST